LAERRGAESLDGRPAVVPDLPRPY
jgi:hypothetical protein